MFSNSLNKTLAMAHLEVIWAFKNYMIPSLHMCRNVIDLHAISEKKKNSTIDDI